MAEPIVWTPGREQAEGSNVWGFMQRHGIADYPELIRRSTQEIEWFWDAIVRDLGLSFFEPYRRVLDASAGVPWCRWFVGGKINVAYNCLDRHAASRPEKRAVVWEGEDGATRTLSYSELSVGTNRLANALKRLGVGPGDRVGLFLPMLPETVMALMACAKIGAIAIPIFSGFGVQAVADRLNDGGAKVLIAVDGFSRKGAVIDALRIADEAAASCPSLLHKVVVRHRGRGELTRPGFDVWWHDAVSAESSECPSLPMDSEAPFLIAYTSGTTGKPKGAVHVHGGFLVKIAQEVCHQVDLRDEDLLFWFTDMGWIMGPWEVVGGLALGGTIFLYEGAPDYPTADRVWRMVERHRVSILGLSPTLARALMKAGGRPADSHDLTSLRILGSTGETWNPDPWRWYFEAVGGGRCPVLNFSGGTETGACFLSVLPISPLKPCTLGGPALGMDVDVFDPEGRPLRGGVGELVCKKPWPGMTRGFWNDGEGRYLRTYWSRWPGVWVHGDWASIDEDGCWFLHGRSDDTIKVSGKRVGPAEVESVLAGHPAVAESAAVGVPHELKGEAVWCFAVLRSGHEPNDDVRRALKDMVTGALGKSFTPERVLLVSELPRTRSGKILRRAVRARVLGRDAGDLSSLENPSALEEIDRVCGQGGRRGS
jgi:acetyl-CoA synthetase